MSHVLCRSAVAASCDLFGTARYKYAGTNVLDKHALVCYPTRPPVTTPLLLVYTT